MLHLHYGSIFIALVVWMVLHRRGWWGVALAVLAGVLSLFVAVHSPLMVLLLLVAYLAGTFSLTIWLADRFARPRSTFSSLVLTQFLWLFVAMAITTLLLFLLAHLQGWSAGAFHAPG